MALTVSSIEADFVKDTKTIGKQSAYLEFHFGDRVHTTETLKSAGKYATWETPVQLTGAGITMKVIAKASKSLAKDKPLGVGEINLVQTAGKGPQTVILRDQASGEQGGSVRLTISGGSPAISGLPHTDGHGVGGMLPGHHHGQQGTEQGYGATGGGVGQQGVGHQGHEGALGGAAAGAGATGVGAAALHHHNQQQGQSAGMQGQHETLGQRIEDKLPGHHTHQGAGGYNQGGVGQTGTSGYNQGGVGQTGASGYNQGGVGQTGATSYNQGGQMGQMPPPSGASTGTGMGTSGMGGGMAGGHGGSTCEHCGGTGTLAQHLQQGLHVGGGQRTQPGVPQQGTY